MLTLKIGDTGTGEDTATWLPGITTVSRIGKSTTDEYTNDWRTYLEGPGIRNYIGIPTPGQRVTLLSAETDREGFYVICTHAWLLGSDGNTIERIAP